MGIILSLVYVSWEIQVLLQHQTLFPVIKLGTLWYLRANLYHNRKRKKIKTYHALHKFIIYFVHLGFWGSQLS